MPIDQDFLMGDPCRTLPPVVLSYVSPVVNSSFKFTPEESAEITKAVSAERILQNQKNAVDHRAQLLAFFQAPHNTGKKMQHVIMDAVTTEPEAVGYGILLNAFSC